MKSQIEKRAIKSFFQYKQYTVCGVLNQEQNVSAPSCAEIMAEAQAASVKETIADLKKAEGDMVRRGVDPLHVQILRYGIMSQKTRLKWLVEFREALDSEK